MRETEIAVTFQPWGRTVHVLRGSRLIEAAAIAGIALDLPCGGEGLCGKCRVVVRRGAAEPGPIEQQRLSAQELQEGTRLACQCVVQAPMTVEVPDTSLLGSRMKILTEGQAAWQPVADPEVRKQFVSLAPAQRGDDAPDAIRLARVVGPVEIGLELARQLPHRLRQAGYCGTAVLAGQRLLDFEPGNTQSACYAVAVDLGTTTLVATLLDVNSGRPLALGARLNPQTGFGDDVVTRIQLAREDPAGLAKLNQCVVQAVDEMIGQLASEAGVAREHIYQATFSGNTTMQQLFCRIDPRYLGEVPFVPVLGSGLSCAAAELGLHVHPEARAYVMPVIGGFVGGDTVSGILATRMADARTPTLLIDIGTNGEIVLSAAGQLWAAATAAGPAFEGARILHGMRASPGAIEKVVLDGHLRTGVIGDVPPTGLCGSALIDLGAELAQDGRLRQPDELPPDTPEDLRRRLVTWEDRSAFVVAAAEETGTGRPIVLTQRDIRQLQLAAGAIRAGTTLLLRRAGVEPGQLGAVYLAGGFGNFIRRNNAQRIGLLPPEVSRPRIRYQGNTSLAGAQLVALSLQARHQAEQIARRCQHVDLSTDPEFRWAFAEAMIFPPA